jgi:putative tRNA adenosine deaminase-associated protein
MSGDFDMELPNRGDDRPGLDDLDELDELAADEAEAADDADADEDDYPDDAGEEDIDLIVAAYREDGQPTVIALDLDLANDLDALIDHLRRIPGDGGALGMVSLASEMFALVRVRGKHVQVFLSDVVAAADWPIARDIIDYLGLEVPEEDDDSYPVGDLDILADAGLPDFELEAIAGEYEEDTATLLERVATRTKFGPEFARAVAAAFG